jgi:hypothetical protein
VHVRRDVPVVLGLFLITVVGQASVGSLADVKVVGGRVHIKATAVPVSEVLDRLSRTTGMKVVYDGAPPTDRLTAAIDAGSETEALSRLLEGLGLTYAFKLDAGGRHVETLFVTGASSRKASNGASGMTTEAPRATRIVSEDYEGEVMPSEDGPDLTDAAAMAAAAPEGMVMDPTSPGYAGGPVGQAGQGVPGIDPQNPAFPSAASFPTEGTPGAPVNPGIPTFPGPASY